MADVKSKKKTIKANVTSVDAVINANIVKKDSVIKANPSTLPNATTERKGIIRIATDEEAIEGISANTAITPHTLRLVTNYVHEQGIASDAWVINHNLNKFPSVSIIDSSGTQFEGNVIYTDENNCTVYMNGATTGKAYLN